MKANLAEGGDDVRRRRARLRAPRVTMAVALGLSVVSVVALSAASPAAPPHPPGPAGLPGHVAFTDDRDRLQQYDAFRGSFLAGGPPAFVPTAPTAHQGEAAVGGDSGNLFVSYVSTAAGSPDVYVTDPLDGNTPIRVTCGATASHPVAAPLVSPVSVVTSGGTVSGVQVDLAWASTATGAGNDGHWNIWTAALQVWNPASGTVTGTGCATGQVGYRVSTPQPLAGQAGDNLWPAWVGRQFALADPGHTAPIDDLLVYESTRGNPLGDIYEQAVDGTTALRRTFGSKLHLADTQPAVLNRDLGTATTFVLLTTTRYRPDGSLASLVLPPPDDAATTDFVSAWPAAPPQSAEAAVGDLCFADQCGPWVGYSTASVDGYGAVQLTLADPTGSALALTTSFVTPVTPDLGVAETHPALVPSGTALGSVLVTRRSIGAGLSTARLGDGSGRAALVAANPDDGAAAYSSDGARIAYSELLLDGTGNPQGRRLVVANGDGPAPAAQDLGQAADLAKGIVDYDSQPTWSPDGTRLAFVREQFVLSGELGQILSAPPRLYVATVGASTASAPPLAGGTTFYDSHPSWSPSGDRIALSRAPAPAEIIPLLGSSANTGTPPTYTLTASVNNQGFGPAPNVTATIALPAGLTLAATPAGCTATAPPVTLQCSYGTLDPRSASGAISFTVGTTAPCGTPSYTVTDDVTTSAAESDTGDNRSSVTIGFDLGVCIAAAVHGATAGRRPAVPAVPAGPAAAVPPAPAQQFATGIRGEPGPPPPTGQPQLWTVDATSGAGAVLTTAAGGDPVFGSTPAWSPDGLHLAYTAVGQIDLATLTAAGGVAAVPETAASLDPVTGYDGNFVPGSGGPPMPSRAAVSTATDPAWTPDGTEIVFAGQPAGLPDNAGIYAVRPDGTGLRTLAQLPQPETEPAVEPYLDATVTLAAAPSSIMVGQQSTVTATVANAGNVAVPSGTLTFTLPGGLSVAPAGVPATCTIALPAVSCTVGALATGTATTVAIVVRGELPGPQPVTAAYPVARDRNPADNTATTTVLVNRVPPTTPVTTPVTTPPTTPVTTPTTPPPAKGADVAVTVAPSQPVGYVGGPLTATVTVRNLGPQPAAITLQTSFSPLLHPTGSPACVTGSAPCGVGTLAPGGSAVFTVHLLPQRDGNPPHGYGAHLAATVSSPLPDPVPANNADSVALPVRQPSIRVLPGVQVPGFVALAFGEDFPPASKVLLTWRPGITTYPGPFTVASDGTLRVPMLIVGRDQLGPRKIVAASVAHLFATVDNTMLVVPRTEAPPNFLDRG